MHTFTMGYFFPELPASISTARSTCSRAGATSREQGLRPVPRGAWRGSTPSSRRRSCGVTVVFFIVTLAAHALAQSARAREARRAQRAARRVRAASSSAWATELFRQAARGRAAAPRRPGRRVLAAALSPHPGGLPHASVLPPDRHAHPRGRPRPTRCSMQLRKLEPVQPPRRPGEGRLPPGVHQPGQSALGHRVRAVRARLPPGAVSERVRALGLHAARVHGARHARHLQRPRRLRPLRAARPTPTTTSGGCRCCARRGAQLPRGRARPHRAADRLLPAHAPRPRERCATKSRSARGTSTGRGSARPTTTPTTSRSSAPFRAGAEDGRSPRERAGAGSGSEPELRDAARSRAARARKGWPELHRVRRKGGRRGRARRGRARARRGRPGAVSPFVHQFLRLLRELACLPGRDRAPCGGCGVAMVRPGLRILLRGRGVRLLHAARLLRAAHLQRGVARARRRARAPR